MLRTNEERAFKVFCPLKSQWDLIKGTEDLANRIGVSVSEIPHYFLPRVTINGVSLSEIKVIVPDV